MCKISFKAMITDTGNSPYHVGDEVLISVKHKREAQLEYDFSDEAQYEPMSEAMVGISRLCVSGGV